MKTDCSTQITEIVTLLLKMTPFGSYTCSKTKAPFVNGTVNNTPVHAVPNVHQTLLHFTDIVNTRLVDTLLDDTPDLVIHGIEVGAVWWPLIRCNECWCCLLQIANSVMGSARRSAVLLKDKELSRHVTHHWQQLF